MFNIIRMVAHDICSIRDEMNEIERNKEAHDRARLEQLGIRKKQREIQKRIDQTRASIQRKS